MIDLHAHILPGVDDGPADLDGSVALAKAALATGTRTLAATSHVDRKFALEPADLHAALRRVRERLAADGLPLDVVQGGELAQTRAHTLDDDGLRGIALGGGRWVLLECPLSNRAPALDPLVLDLQRRGFGVLLAHPERSPSFQRSPDALERLIGTGALAQVTAAAFKGDFGDLPRRTAFAMLERGLVHVLASDTHDPSHRSPDLLVARRVLERRYGEAIEEQLAWMATDAPGAVLADIPPPERPELPRPAQRGLRRLFRA